MLVKKEHLEWIRQGLKTMTRRRHKRPLQVGKVYELKRHWLDKSGVKVLIVRRYRQQLGRISDEDAVKEGYTTVDEFKQAWTEINGSWEPYEIVWVYEFRLSTKKSERTT